MVQASSASGSINTGSPPTPRPALPPCPPVADLPPAACSAPPDPLLRPPCPPLASEFTVPPQLAHASATTPAPQSTPIAQPMPEEYARFGSSVEQRLWQHERHDAKLARRWLSSGSRSGWSSHSSAFWCWGR